MTGPSKEMRSAYKRKMAATIFFPASLIVILFLGAAASNQFYYRLTQTIPLVLVLVGVGSIKIAEWRAVRKFGDIEKQSQAEEARDRENRLERLAKSEGFKKRAYTKRVFARLMLMLIVVFYPIAWITEQYFDISGWVTFNAALFAAILLAYILASIQTQKHFGDK
jgi:uncharacterized membrane protein YcjF (UPF0283 family)